VPAFINRLKREVEHLASKHKLSASKAFLLWFAATVLELTDEEALEAISIEGANDKRVDLFYVNSDQGKVIIVQGQYSTNGRARPKLDKLDGLFGCLNWLSSPEALRRDGKHELAAAAEEYGDAIREGNGVEFWFVYAGPKDAMIEKHIGVYNQNPDNIDNRRGCRHCSLDLLEQYHGEATGHSKRLDSECISLVDAKHFKYVASFGEALVATVPAPELVRLYKKYEDRLFERNVRLFLGAKKGSINAGIAETLKSDDRSNFWAYNNGLTVVCSGFTTTLESVTVNDFCIVNGCQSTRSLADNEDHIDASITVLVRILAVGNGLVDDVIRYTNSQNPIRAWDIASQNRTQRRLKQAFDDLKKPYIYVTRRGDHPKENLAKYCNGGKPRQIKLAEVAQYLAAFVGYPVLAYKDKALIYTKRHDDIFPHDIKVEEVLFASVCSQEVTAVTAKRRGNGTDEEKRILTKGGSLFTMAVVGHIARLRNGAVFLKSMNEEQITSKNGRERLNKYAQYALAAYLGAVRDYCENTRSELTTALRSREFFGKIKDRIGRKYETDALAGEKWLKNALPKLT
jgi:hypothetical protein